MKLIPALLGLFALPGRYTLGPKGHGLQQASQTLKIGAAVLRLPRWRSAMISPSSLQAVGTSVSGKPSGDTTSE